MLVLAQVITHFGHPVSYLRWRQRQDQRLPENPPDSLRQPHFLPNPCRSSVNFRLLQPIDSAEITESNVSPDKRARLSTTGPQCEICSLISASCRSSSCSLSRADSYIFDAVSSGIGDLYKNIHVMSIVISLTFTLFTPCHPDRKPNDPERKRRGCEAEWRDPDTLSSATPHQGALPRHVPAKSHRFQKSGQRFHNQFQPATQNLYQARGGADIYVCG
jgi:hypothetical protein